MGGRMRRLENANDEIRMTNDESMIKHQPPKRFSHWNFKFDSSFVIRISSFRSLLEQPVHRLMHRPMHVGSGSCASSVDNFSSPVRYFWRFAFAFVYFLSSSDTKVPGGKGKRLP